MTGQAQKEKMLAAHPCGDPVLTRPASIGVGRLPDLKDRDPRDLMHETSLQAGRRNWRAPIAVRAQHNRKGAQRRAAGG
jgi:hypothetical protein